MTRQQNAICLTRIRSDMTKKCNPMSRAPISKVLQTAPIKWGNYFKHKIQDLKKKHGIKKNVFS